MAPQHPPRPRKEDNPCLKKGAYWGPHKKGGLLKPPPLQKTPGVKLRRGLPKTGN